MYPLKTVKTSVNSVVIQASVHRDKWDVWAWNHDGGKGVGVKLESFGCGSSNVTKVGVSWSASQVVFGHSCVNTNKLRINKWGSHYNTVVFFYRILPNIYKYSSFIFIVSDFLE